MIGQLRSSPGSDYKSEAGDYREGPSERMCRAHSTAGDGRCKEGRKRDEQDSRRSGVSFVFSRMGLRGAKKGNSHSNGSKGKEGEKMAEVEEMRPF